ncbi:MAG: hypothetical protein HC887_11330 [Desulfobacteraceae bacterium]|nr:hypothetical protein [Desulfobacteraceae bacterium]
MIIAETLIMSNRMIDKDRLEALWEEIKMLDILEIAEEKGRLLGINEGKLLGINEGKLLGVLETAREILTDDLIERFGAVPEHIIEQIGKICNPIMLKVLRRQISKCGNIGEFEAVMRQVLS